MLKPKKLLFSVPRHICFFNLFDIYIYIYKGISYNICRDVGLLTFKIQFQAKSTLAKSSNGKPVFLRANNNNIITKHLNRLFNVVGVVSKINEKEIRFCLVSIFIFQFLSLFLKFALNLYRCLLFSIVF